jgi:hypothetical protein
MTAKTSTTKRNSRSTVGLIGGAVRLHGPVPMCHSAIVISLRVAVMLSLAAHCFAGCGRRRTQPRPELVTDSRASDAAPAGDAGALERWPELASLPRVVPVQVIELPVRIDVPRFEVYGPLISGEVAIVASSQFGFTAVDWRHGKIAWNKPTGAHIAPPVALADGTIALLGDCATAPQTELAVMGCLRVVTSAGADLSYGAVVGDAELAKRMRGPGPQRSWRIDDRHLAWQRGDTSVTIDLTTGRAVADAPAPAPLRIRYRDSELEITLDDGLLSAKDRAGRIAWRAPGRFSAILGQVAGQLYESPMVRVVIAAAARSGASAVASSYFDVLDLDAMSAAGGQAAFPSPGIQLLGTASGAEAEAALAVRLDRSLRRDYVVTYTSGARIAWCYPLPEVLRTDPVGLAISDQAVLVFSDGDTLTVLPAIR